MEALLKLLPLLEDITQWIEISDGRELKKAYDLLVKGQGEVKQNYESVFQDSYEKGITDEFIEPSLLHGVDGEINDEDVVLCFNFRTDRCRQITSALTQKDFLSYGMEKLNLHYFTMTNYDRNFQNVNVVYDKENLSMTIGEVLSNSSKTQLRIAETEKYPHVTYFFSGGKESTFPKESRIVVASPKVATYDLQPEMSANKVTSEAISFIEKNQPDFICLNFANPDMVGHTGVKEAIIKACEKVDSCLQKINSYPARKSIFCCCNCRSWKCR